MLQAAQRDAMRFRSNPGESDAVRTYCCRCYWAVCCMLQSAVPGQPFQTCRCVGTAACTSCLSPCACDSFCLQPAALLPVATHIYTCNMLFAACSISCFGQAHSKCQCYSTTPHVMCALPVAVEHAHAMIVPASCCPLLPAELQAWAGEWCSSQDG